MAQIDMVRNALAGRASAELKYDFGVRIYEEGQSNHPERSEYFDPTISATHDVDASFSSATFPVAKPFSLDNRKLWIIEWYVGWRGQNVLAFKGEIQTHTKSHWKKRDSLTAAGVLRRTQEGLAPALLADAMSPAAFYNLDSPYVADLRADMSEAGIPIEGQYGIRTDGDIIIKILALYGIVAVAGGWNFQIHSSWWKPAMQAPIFWNPGQAGWQIIQELDRCTRYRTFDAANGAVYRLPVYGGPPPDTLTTFQDYDGDGKVADLLQLQHNESYTVYNQVRVRGAPIRMLDGTVNPEQTPDEVVGVAPDGEPPSSPFIPDPPRIRTDDTLQSALIETVPDARRMAYERLGYLSVPTQEVSLTTFGCADYDVGHGIGVRSRNTGASGFSYRGYLVTHQITGMPFRSQMKLRGVTSDISIPPIIVPPIGLPPRVNFTTSMWTEYVVPAGAPPPVTGGLGSDLGFIRENWGYYSDSSTLRVSSNAGSYYPGDIEVVLLLAENVAGGGVPAMPTADMPGWAVAWSDTNAERRIRLTALTRLTNENTGPHVTGTLFTTGINSGLTIAIWMAYGRKSASGHGVPGTPSNLGNQATIFRRVESGSPVRMPAVDGTHSMAQVFFDVGGIGIDYNLDNDEGTSPGWALRWSGSRANGNFMGPSLVPGISAYSETTTSGATPTAEMATASPSTTIFTAGVVVIFHTVA